MASPLEVRVSDYFGSAQMNIVQESNLNIHLDSSIPIFMVEFTRMIEYTNSPSPYTVELPSMMFTIRRGSILSSRDECFTSLDRIIGEGPDFTRPISDHFYDYAWRMQNLNSNKRILKIHLKVTRFSSSFEDWTCRLRDVVDVASLPPYHRYSITEPEISRFIERYRSSVLDDMRFNEQRPGLIELVEGYRDNLKYNGWLVCGLCSEKLEGPQNIRRCFNHHFHKGCMRWWKRLSPTCPVCRMTLLEID